MERMLMRRGIVHTTLAIALAAIMTGCAGAVSYEREIPLEAHWKCDVQHRTYTDLDAMADDLAGRLAGEGISEERYARFKADMESSPDLRSAVLTEYTAYCGDAGG